MTRLQQIINLAKSLKEELDKVDLDIVSTHQLDRFLKHKQDLNNIVNFYNKHYYIQRQHLSLLELISRIYSK